MKGIPCYFSGTPGPDAPGAVSTIALELGGIRGSEKQASEMSDRSKTSGSREVRFEGALLGAALGDALGFPRKGRSRIFLQAIEAPVEAGFHRDSSGFHPPGQVSDDFQGLRATVQSILEGGRIDSSLLAEFLVPLWRDGKIVDSSASSAEAVEALARGRASVDQSGQPAGCFEADPVARAVAVGLWAAEDAGALIEGTRAVIEPTHRDPVVVASAGAVAAAVGHLIGEDEIYLGTFIDRLEAVVRPLHEGLAEMIVDMPRLLSMTEYRAFERLEAALSGLGLPRAESFWFSLPNLAPFQVLAALFIFLRTPFKVGVALEGAFQTGGEIPTTCALGGALSGALRGRGQLPSKLLEALPECAAIAEEARALLARRDQPEVPEEVEVPAGGEGDES